jgi:hypothetical protein
MKTKTLLITGLLVTALLLTPGCAGHPAGWTNPRELSDIEKERVTDAALDTPEIRAQLEKNPIYKTSLEWIAIVWNGSRSAEQRILDYDWGNDPNFALVTKSSVYYALVLFNFGEPPNWQVYIAVNPDTGTAFMVMENPFRTGPLSPSTNTSKPTSNLTPQAQQPIEIISVLGPLQPIVPAGPIVEITLKNVGAEPVVSLVANLVLSRAFSFEFDVIASNPLLPEKTISVKRTLIGGGFSDGIPCLWRLMELCKADLNSITRDRHTLPLAKTSR